MVAHHLIIDGVSWRILLNQLEQIIQDSLFISNSQTFYSWSKAIINHSKKLSKLNRLYWDSLNENRITIPFDKNAEVNLEKDSAYLLSCLSPPITHDLMKTLRKKDSITVDELLLSSLAYSLSIWMQSNFVLINVERHGRENISPTTNPENTIGWFTNLFPIRINVDKDKSVADSIFSITQQMSAYLTQGLDYGILRYLKKDTALNIHPQVSFNYWGRFDQVLSKNSVLQFKDLLLISHPENGRPHLIDLEISIDNHEALKIKWIYNKNIHKKETIQNLNKLYLRTISEFLNFPLESARLSNAAFNDNAFKSIKKNELHRYELTSMQKGLLFHTVNKPGCEAYAVQLVWDLHPNCNINILQQAFRQLCLRHSILRTYFAWENVKEPFQYETREVELLWHEYDFSDSMDQNTRLDHFLKIDRQANFSLSSLPLIRVTIVKLSNSKYTIVICTHHILLDGWSISILISELGKIYQLMVENKTVRLGDTPPFKHYIEWSRKKNLKKSEYFWKKYLSGFYTPTNLMVIEEAYSNRLMNYEIATLQFSPRLTEKINKLCKLQKITISTVMQAIWGLLLCLYNDCDDVLFGVTISARPPELEGSDRMVGLLINTVPMRIKINYQTSIKNYLNSIQQNFIKLAEQVNTPLSQIQAWSEITEQSLFDSILVVENYPTSKISGLGIQFKDIKIFDPTHYPLTLSIISNEELCIKFGYDRNCIRDEKIKRLKSHFYALVNKVVQNLDETISNLTLLSKNEEKIILEWNNTYYPKHDRQTIVQLFEAQVAQTPHKIALIFNKISLNYAELNKKANQLAHHLRNHGAKPDLLIALCVERNLNLIIGLLGIIKSGAAYVPIDPFYPEERVHYLFENCQAPILLTETTWLKKHKKSIPADTKVFFLDQDAALSAESTNNPQQLALPQHLMYVIYTSGSTGKPKGVMVEHHSIINFLQSMQQILQLTTEDKWFAITPISFDISGLEIYLPLITGGECILADQETLTDGKKLKRAIEINQITIMQATPMSWQLLLNVAWRNETSIKILCGGETLTQKLGKELLNYTESFFNLYGPTETTIWSTVNVITKKDLKYTILPVGRPIRNTEIYILNSHQHLNPIEIAGELYIGGEGVARGYLFQDELTHDRFISHSSNLKIKHKKLYRTGDLVRWLPNGILEYVKRLDDQIKLRGFRIELGEIEARINSYPFVQQSVVLVTYNKLNAPYLLACCILKDNADFDLSSLKKHLKKFLPTYMIPSQFFIVSYFPLTPNNKIDKKALALAFEKNLLAADSSIEKILPITTEEKSIAKVWSKVLLLPIEQIGREDNFFELGGHSLSALQVISDISRLFHAELEVRMLFDHPTISELAEKYKSLSFDSFALEAATQRKLYSSFDECLVTLKPSGKKPPLFLIHPIGGTVFWYVPLAKYFDINRPLYAIQDPGLEKDIIPFLSVHEMAAYYIEVIRKIQPHGPYFIAGASAGANVSIEIAYQLQLKSEVTAFIGLLDGWGRYPEVLQNKEIFESMMLRQYHIMQKKFAYKGIKIADRLLKLQWQRSKMNTEYIPPRLENKLILFKASETMPIFQLIDDPYNHWQKYTNQPVEVCMVPGNHETMFNEENAIILARLLNDKLK